MIPAPGRRWSPPLRNALLGMLAEVLYTLALVLLALGVCGLVAVCVR